MADREFVEKLRERLLDFAVDILRFLNSLPYNKEFDVLKYQLSKSATSIGANYEESQASTHKEFITKNRIALREAKESLYWLKIIQKMQIGNKKTLENLISECKEITSMFGSIVSNADKNQTVSK